MLKEENGIAGIRQAEAKSHMEAYSSFELYAAGSWLAKPVGTVMDTLVHFTDYQKLRVLDLGSGVGRNAVAVAKHFQGRECQIDCVDILEMAIEKLNENARKYGVSEAIRGILSSIDTYEIREDSYDLVIAISALEHVCSRKAFVEKLQEIKWGLRSGGIACFIVNSGVRECVKATGVDQVPQFEVNIPTAELVNLLEESFPGWMVLKRTVVHQQYDIPRENGISLVDTDVVTYVVRKP